jgi:anoctamin-4
MWKRRQAILKWEWDLSDNEDIEEIRPEFEANVKSRRLNPITKVQEAFVSGKEKTLRISLTGGVVLFMVMIYLTIGFFFIKSSSEWPCYRPLV